MSEYQKEAKLLIEKGDIPAALNVYVYRTISYPNDHNSWLNRARLEQELNNLSDAIRSGLSAVASDPDYLDAWLFLGELAEKLNKVEEAENCAWQALRLDSDNVTAYAIYANALYILGRLADSEEACLEALVLQPDNVSVLSCLVLVLASQSRNDEAYGHLQCLLNSHSGFIDNMCEVGFDCISKNKVTLAINLFNLLIRVNNDIEAAYVGLSHAYLLAGRVGDAEKNLEIALKIFPDLSGVDVLLKKIKIASKFKLNI